MNKICKEHFFECIASMYSENMLCENCPIREECSTADGSIEKCYDNVLKALKESTNPKISAEEWVKQMTELHKKDKNIGWECDRIFDKKGCVITVVVFDTRNAIKRATAMCRTEEFDIDKGIAIAYARLRGFPIHEDFASKHDVIL